MINVSEHVDKPNDMLMFLGEYFKEHINRSNDVMNNIKEAKENAKKELDSYYIS